MSDREAFEKWLTESSFPDDGGRLKELVKESMWEAWQAALEHRESEREFEHKMLLRFAAEVLEAWPVSGLDGCDIQDIGETTGLLVPITRHEPCGESCPCAEVCSPEDFEEGITCYRKHALLSAQKEPG